MRIVVFTTNYPPLINPRAFRIRNFVEFNNEQNEILVITSPVKGYKENAINIIRCGISMYPDQEFRNSLKKYAFFRLIHKLFWPDDKLFHQFFYFINYFFKHRLKDDVIITVSNPFSSHLIGLVLKLIWKHKWTSDIGDIYYHNFHQSVLSKFLEKIALQKSDHIILNSESIRDYYISNYKVSPKKITIIPNGISLDISKIKKIPTKFIRLSYIGNTYAGVREGIDELNILLDLIKKHSGTNIQIQLFGTQYYKVQDLSKINSPFIQEAYCKNQDELIQAYSNTDILINFANKNNPGLPSKLAEYASTGLPIINFIYSNEDPSKYILNSYSNSVLHVLIESAQLENIFSYIENSTNLIIIHRDNNNFNLKIKFEWRQWISTFNT